MTNALAQSHRSRTPHRRDARTPDELAAPDVEIVIPVLDEERVLARSILRLHHFLKSEVPLSWQITIVDNGSTDLTPEVARRLAERLPEVSLMRLEQRGRGRALRAAWSASRARVVCYMDVDLSTDLRALLPLIAPLLSGHSELAIGTRLAPGSRTTRGLKREIISRTYNRILRAGLRARFSDAQCGFKAVRADVLPGLLADVRDEAWFFDTELLVLAQRRGLRIHEVPVDWVEDPDSRVDILSTALADLRGVARLALAAPLVCFGLIGLASTAAYALLFLALAGVAGSPLANLVSLALTAVANTPANRRFTFGIRGRRGLVRQHAAGLVVFAVALGLTSGTLAMLGTVEPHASRLLQAALLVIATLTATAMRYVALSTWVFPSRRRSPRPPLASIA